MKMSFFQDHSWKWRLLQTKTLHKFYIKYIFIFNIHVEINSKGPGLVLGSFYFLLEVNHGPIRNPCSKCCRPIASTHRNVKELCFYKHKWHIKYQQISFHQENLHYTSILNHGCVVTVLTYLYHVKFGWWDS